MLKPLVCHQSADDFLCLSAEMQIAMYESLAANYSYKFLPDWMQLLQGAILGDFGAAYWLMSVYEGLTDFAALYMSQQHNGDYFGVDQLWLLNQEYEELCANEDYYSDREQAA